MVGLILPSFGSSSSLSLCLGKSALSPIHLKPESCSFIEPIVTFHVNAIFRLDVIVNIFISLVIKESET